MRSAIVFELAPFSELTMDAQLDAVSSTDHIGEATLAELHIKAIENSSESLAGVERTSLIRKRSAAVRRYVLERAAGTCEGCKNPAPFVTNAGSHYLEPHHIGRVSDGGPDDPSWVAAVCANCHRRAHHSSDSIAFNDSLAVYVGERRAVD
jgi:5-methylcytosine-specific restriction protein A